MAAAGEALLRAERELAEAEGSEYAEPLDVSLDCDVGAPLPHVVASGYVVHLAYFLRRPPPRGWHGESVQVVTAATAAPIAVLTFAGYAAFRMGSPNDEAIAGHPLTGRGLSSYRAHTVRRSSWIAEVERQNSVHPMHRGGWAERLLHYLFAFHDEMFECVAPSYMFEVRDCTMEEAVLELATRVTSG